MAFDLILLGCYACISTHLVLGVFDQLAQMTLVGIRVHRTDLHVVLGFYSATLVARSISNLLGSPSSCTILYELSAFPV